MKRLLLAAFVCGCGSSVPPPSPSVTPAPSPVPPIAQPVAPAAPIPKGNNVYGLAEALADALSGPWQFVGTGEWFGFMYVNACVYTNERVIIVNHYCTGKEINSTGVEVFSPTRGRVYIYAEGKAPISTTRRDAWFSFRADAELPTDPPPRLDMTYAELRAWTEKRYYLNAPACYGGVENSKPLDGCLRLDAAVEDWSARNKDFLAEPPDDWYRLVKEMRVHAKHDARPYVDVPKPKPPAPPPDPKDRDYSRPETYTPPKKKK